MVPQSEHRTHRPLALTASITILSAHFPAVCTHKYYNIYISLKFMRVNVALGHPSVICNQSFILTRMHTACSLRKAHRSCRFFGDCPSPSNTVMDTWVTRDGVVANSRPRPSSPLRFSATRQVLNTGGTDGNDCAPQPFHG